MGGCEGKGKAALQQPRQTAQTRRSLESDSSDLAAVGWAPIEKESEPNKTTPPSANDR